MSEIRPEKSGRVDGSEQPSDLGKLDRALEAWTNRTHPVPLLRWLDAELDAEGIPRRLPVFQWWPALERFAKGFPEEARSPLQGFFRAALSFSEPSFAPVFGGDRPNLRILKELAKNLGEPGLKTVVSWWSTTTRRGSGFAPPLPAVACDPRVLAMLRADWSDHGDLLGIDQRGRGGRCQIGFFGRGHRLLGTNWPTHGSTTAARVICWSTGMHADLLEWSFLVGSTRITRIAALLRGRKLALLADQVDGPEPIDALKLSLADGAQTEAIAESRALRMRIGRQSLARVLPIGLPSAGYPTDRGSLRSDGEFLVLEQRPEAPRRWLPLLFSWDNDRDRRAATWRRLTVAERSKACPPGVAFAARVAWGTGDGILIYRSLARPAMRSFLGHQTTARFLIATYSETGDVTPLVTID